VALPLQFLVFLLSFLHMLRIRLSRVGRKHDPSYRVIVTEKGRGPQTGNYVEQVGTYDARSDEHNLKADRITHWISVGAQPSDTVHNLLLKAGVIEGDTVNPLPKKTPIVSEEDSSEEEAEEESAETADDVEETDESADEAEPEKKEEEESPEEDEEEE